MRKTNIIIAIIMCTIIVGFIMPGFKAMAASESPKKEPVVGGWVLVDDNRTAMMSDKDITRIDTALKETGGDFKVLSLVATQVVSGANYMYLVYGTEEGTTVPAYYFVTVYEDTKGNDSVIGTTPFYVTSVETGTPMGQGATGAWAARGTGKPGMFPDQNAQSSFDEINKSNVIYNPVALLATQVVSGTNYKALCQGDDQNLYVVTWYKDLKGNASLTSAEYVDIGAYV